jgi:hypothetical protein
MKNWITIPFLLGFLSLSTLSFSQKDWRWNQHGVGFSAPANLRITTNNASEFTAESSDLILSIYVEQDGEVNADGLAEALVAAAEELEYDEITDVDELEIDDFTGYYVEGTKDGVGALIITLLDKKSATNLVIVLAYTTDNARDKAIDIADSFYAFD